jgi:hypothetical protein
MLLDAQSPSTSPLTPLMAFWWGAGGSFAIEILSLYSEIRAANATGLPAYYKNPLFWFVRILVTAIAGGLAVAEEATKPLLAINIGASAPAILQLLTKPPGGAAAGPPAAAER